MQITVDIPDEFAALVQARGLTPEGYVRSLIDDAVRVAPATAIPARPKMNMQEFLERMAANSEAIPQLPDAAFTRASFYQDHD